MILKSFTTPKNNKEIFINPAYEEIPGIIELNNKRFQSYTFNINGIPFSQFRKHVRYETLKMASEYTERILSICSALNIPYTDNLSCINDSYTPTKAIIQTGHSPAISHPGVIIKHCLVNNISKTTNGIGVNMVVDNDACHDNCLNVPNINGLNAYIERIEYVAALHNLAFEEIKYADSKLLTTFKENVLKALHNHDMKITFNNFIKTVISISRITLKFSDLFTCARHIFLLRFGVGNLEIPVSVISESDSFLHFFLQITANAKSFVNIYNAKLSEYRKSKRISSKANPLPDLMEQGYTVEMPFWIWKENEPRKSLYASMANERRVSIICENRIVEHFDFDKGTGSSNNNLNNLKKLRDLINNGIKIRPKAIVNTMYSRLFFSDLFIHGIGGAKYDIITDEIIREFFHVEPPEYATISATLYLPYEPSGVSEEDLKKLKHIIKDMGYNPDRYITYETMEDVNIKSMLSEKKNLIARETVDIKEKRRTFDRLKQLNNMMKEKINPLINDKKIEMEEIEKKLRYNSIVMNREYPFCLYPESMLRKLFKFNY